MSGLFDTGSTPAPMPTLAEQDTLLIQQYQLAGRTLDDLPYTSEFEKLFSAVNGEQSGVKQLGKDRRAVFHRLHNLRKAKKLPRLGRATEAPPSILPEEESILAQLVIERVGTLGQRDQLPFDPKFDDLVQVFNQRTGRDLTQRAIWRLVAKLAK